MNHKENEIELTALFVNISASQTRLKLASQGTADTEYESDSVYCFFPVQSREKKIQTFSPDTFQSSICHNITTGLCSVRLYESYNYYTLETGILLCSPITDANTSDIKPERITLMPCIAGFL